MKAIVNQEECISCGMCIDICPEVFAYNNESKSISIVDEIPEENINSAQEASDACPVYAITVADDEIAENDDDIAQNEFENEDMEYDDLDDDFNIASVEFGE